MVKPVTLVELDTIKIKTRKNNSRIKWQFVRRIRAEIANRNFKIIEHLHRKIAVVAHFYFLRSDLEGQDDFFELLDARVPRSYWNQIRYRYLIMMMQFERAAEFAQSCINPDTSPDPFIHLSIEATLLSGNANEGVELAKRTLDQNWNVLDRAGQRRVFHLLIQAGESDLVNSSHGTDIGQANFLERVKKLHPVSDCTVPILCISLDRDQRRLRSTRYFMPAPNTFIHSKAVLGSALPRSVLDIGGIPNKRRTDAEIGCSLSHLKAWETVARICSDDDYALILEDDARFIYGPASGLSQIVEKAQKIEAGLVFVNDRSSQQLPFVSDPTEFELVPLDDIRTVYEPKNPRRDPGWGADGYLVNGKTARYLASVWLEVGLDGALDWQLYLFGQKDIGEIAMAPRYRGALEGLKAARESGKEDYFLNAYVSELSITTSEDYGYSSISSGHV